MMMMLRPAQLDALGEPRRSRFEERVRAHLCHYFGAASAMREQAILEFIRHGIDRGRHYGICTERDVCKYINLMFVLGRDFDLDPQLPWAAEILDGAWLDRNATTIELLYRTALEHES